MTYLDCDSTFGVEIWQEAELVFVSIDSVLKHRRTGAYNVINEY